MEVVKKIEALDGTPPKKPCVIEAGGFFFVVEGGAADKS